MINTKVAIGTQVIGNEKASCYNVIKVGCVCTLERNNVSDEKFISVRTSGGDVFSVRRDCFDVYEVIKLPSATCTRQKRRDEAIEEYISNTSKIKYSFKVDEKKRTVKVAIHSEKFKGDVIICGAKCHEDDDWELGTGLQLAYERFQKIIETVEKSSLKVGTAIKIKTFKHAIITVFMDCVGNAKGEVFVNDIDREAGIVHTTPFLTDINGISTIIAVNLPISDIAEA